LFFFVKIFFLLLTFYLSRLAGLRYAAVWCKCTVILSKTFCLPAFLRLRETIIFRRSGWLFEISDLFATCYSGIQSFRRKHFLRENLLNDLLFIIYYLFLTI